MVVWFKNPGVLGEIEVGGFPPRRSHGRLHVYGYMLVEFQAADSNILWRA